MPSSRLLGSGTREVTLTLSIINVVRALPFAGKPSATTRKYPVSGRGIDHTPPGGADPWSPGNRVVHDLRPPTVKAPYSGLLVRGPLPAVATFNNVRTSPYWSPKEWTIKFNV